MKREISKKNSIYIQLLKLLALAAAAAAVSFFLFWHAGRGIILFCSRGGVYSQKANERYIEDLRQYAAKENISSTDTEKLTVWVKQHKPVSLQIYKDDILVYDSAYPFYDRLSEEEIHADYYDWATYYDIQFADGEGVAAIHGFHVYQLYNAFLIGEIILSFFVFVLVVMLGIRNKMRYIRTLSEEIEILEGGNLDYPISVEGHDELSILAQGLNDMRVSFRTQVENESRLVESNKKMVTALSHDLRTPMTSLLIYAEILESGKYRDETQFRECVGKIAEKTRRLKHLTDHLFEYSLVSEKGRAELESPADFRDIFYDMLSEMCGCLEEKGFRVETRLQETKGKTAVNPDYVMRIFDNITSNILKYADHEEPVRIGTVQYEPEEADAAETADAPAKNGISEAGFLFRNRKKKLEKKADSSRIGVQNIRSMMEKMGGRCEVSEDGEWYEIRVIFPLV